MRSRTTRCAGSRARAAAEHAHRACQAGAAAADSHHGRGTAPHRALEDIVRTLAHAHGVPLSDTRITGSPSISVIVQLVRDGFGVAAIPVLFVDALIESGEVVELPLQPSPPSIVVSMSRRADAPRFVHARRSPRGRRVMSIARRASGCWLRRFDAVQAGEWRGRVSGTHSTSRESPTLACDASAPCVASITATSSMREHQTRMRCFRSGTARLGLSRKTAKRNAPAESVPRQSRRVRPHKRAAVPESPASISRALLQCDRPASVPGANSTPRSTSATSQSAARRTAHRSRRRARVLQHVTHRHQPVRIRTDVAVAADGRRNRPDRHRAVALDAARQVAQAGRRRCPRQARGDCCPPGSRRPNTADRDSTRSAAYRRASTASYPRRKPTSAGPPSSAQRHACTGPRRP